MYLFLIFGLPLGFALLVVSTYPRIEFTDTRKTFGRGLAAFIPLWIVARILGAIVPASYGSILLGFHEWADRLLPYAALPALGYLVFYRLGELIPAGPLCRRFTAFYAGALAPVGLCETVRVWGTPEPYVLFLLPILLAAICVIMPKIVSLLYGSYGLELGRTIAAAVICSLIVSLCPFLFLVHLWPLALLIVAAVAAGTWRYVFPDLEARSPATSYSD
jgi:hypothetical protein